MNMHSYIAGTPNFMAPEAYTDDPCVVVTQTQRRASNHKTLAIGAGLNCNRAALSVRLRNGLTVVNVHLTSGNERRARAELLEIYEEVTGSARDNPWLIIGDFNHDPTGDGYRGVSFAQGPQHAGGSHLDWAMAGNITSLAAGEYPRYHGADHGPWYVDVDF